MSESTTQADADKSVPILSLRFECDAYAINLHGPATAEAVNLAVAALKTFKRSYFGAEEEEEIKPPAALTEEK